MIVSGADTFRNSLPKTGRLLGLDVGSKTIGLALSDAGRMIASPLTTLARTKFTADAGRLKELLREHGVCGLVIGYPLNMNGTEGPRCQSVRQFTVNLEAHTDLPMLLWDERLSSMAIERMMDEAEWSRGKQKEHVDKLAAAYILQGFLDSGAKRA